jgi:hypothetical protein
MQTEDAKMKTTAIFVLLVTRKWLTANYTNTTNLLLEGNLSSGEVRTKPWLAFDANNLLNCLSSLLASLQPDEKILAAVSRSIALIIL